MCVRECVRAGNFVFKSRVVMPPMATAGADESGHVTDAMLRYYDEKSACRLFGAVIVEHCYVDRGGIAHPRQVSVSDDSDVEGLSRLAGVIHGNGAPAVLQISHAGSLAKRACTGVEAVAPSAVVSPTGRSAEVPRELSAEEIASVRDCFIDAAVRAKQAGFDAVEVHSAHGYLLDQFLSPLSNLRDDAWGGDVINRVRLHCEILRGIRERTGGDFPVFIRMGAGDFKPGGLSKADAAAAAVEFERAGADVIDVSGGMCFYSIDDSRAGYFDSVAAPVYDAVSVPVILTGGVKCGEDVVDVLGRGVCDLVGVGRAVFRDSSWMEREVGPLSGV